MVGKATLIAGNDAVLGVAAYTAAFLVGGMPKQGKAAAASWRTVAALVAELDATREENTRLRAELDAANDAVVELLHQRDEAELALGRALLSVEVA